MSTAPRMLIPAFVTRPAKPRVKPRANTSGHAVGVGKWTTSSETSGLCGSFIGLGIAFAMASVLFLSAADDVDNGKDHHPDPVDKMPIEREHLELFGVLRFQLAQQRKNQHDRKHGQADDDVACMQTNEGIERGAKEVGADGQAVVINQLLPFEPGTDKKDRT